MSKDRELLKEQYFRNLSAFDEAAFNALEGTERGTEIEFVCPVCLGVAHAGTSAYNGHRYGRCESCGLAFIE